MNETKRCPGCGETKSLDRFYGDKYQPSGRTAFCKPCDNSRRYQRRIATPEGRAKQLEYQRAYAARKRAEKAGEEV
jgi:hypothetical protein